MLSVLAAPGVFHDRREIFDGTTLAAINFSSNLSGNFVVSGEDDRLTAAQAALDKLDIIAVRLPVRCGFHSALVDPIRDEFLSAAAAIRLSSPRLPIYSSARGRALGPELTAWPAYLWDVVRQPIRFDTVITQAFAEPGGYYFVDLSASGSFASFLKHGYGARYRSAPAINQFGNNAASMERLRGELRAAIGQGSRHAVA
jgi:acyl transferase domain-containing protein